MYPDEARPAHDEQTAQDHEHDERNMHGHDEVGGSAKECRQVDRSSKQCIG